MSGRPPGSEYFQDTTEPKGKIHKIYYENPLTKEITMRVVEMIIQDEITEIIKCVRKIKIDIDGLFAEIHYTDGSIERTYKIHTIIFK